MSNLCPKPKNSIAETRPDGGNFLDPWIQGERIDLFYGDDLAFVAGVFLTGLEFRNARGMGDHRIGRMAVGEQDRVEREVMRAENLPVEDDRAKEKEARNRLLAPPVRGL